MPTARLDSIATDGVPSQTREPGLDPDDPLVCGWDQFQAARERYLARFRDPGSLAAGQSASGGQGRDVLGR